VPIPTRNFKFHPTRRWEIDWAWESLKIGIEVDGGVWSSGAHARPANIIRDMQKHNALIDLSWRVWRFTPQEAISGLAVQHVAKFVRGES